jgi:hypothetical protein
VGNNGETLVADSSASTGLRYQGTMAAGKNAIINGGLDFWQRGTTGTFSGSFVYLADRWANVCTGTAPTCTVSRQTADTAGLQYGVRFGRNSGQTNTGSPNLITVLETAQSIPYAGKTVVLSFSAKAGANAPNNLTPFITSGTGTDQALGSFFGGWTGQVTLYNSSISTTTTMTRYSVSVTVPANATQLGVSFYYSPSGTAGANEWFQIEGVQLEVGLVPTNFTRAGGTIQGELAACQRYYLRVAGDATNGGALGVGLATSTTAGQVMTTFPVTLRIAPTALEQTGTAADYTVRHGSGTTTCSAVPTVGNVSQYAATTGFTVASGLTAGSGAVLRQSGATVAYLAWSAEL